MSKFCMYCGKELADGEACNCHEKAVARGTTSQTTSASEEASGSKTANTQTNFNAQTTYASPQGGPTFYTAPPVPPKKSAFSKLMGRTWYYIEHFFTAPADTISKAANQKDYGAGIIFMILSSIICSALGIAVLNRLVAVVNSATASALGAKYFTLNSFLQPFGLTVMGGFFSGIVLMLVVDLVFCALSLAAARIAKSKVTFSSIIGAVGIASLGTTCGFIVAVALSLLMPILALPLGVGVILLDFSLTYIALVKSFKLSANKMAYLFAAIMIAMTIFFVICYKLTPVTVDFSSVLPSSTTTMTPSSGSSGLDSFFGSGF